MNYPSNVVLNDKNLWKFEAAFHKKWLDYLKRVTGASFVAYERYKDNYTIKVKGVGEETYFIEVPNIKELTEEDYKEMAWKINTEQNTISSETQTN